MKKESVALRIILIISMTILLFIPLLMIQSLITERQNYRNEAIYEIAKGWAGTQSIGGPIISISRKIEKSDRKGTKYFVEMKDYFLPETLKIEAEVVPEKRYKGIYEIMLYKSKLKITGSFNIPELKEKYSGAEIEECYISFNISDLRGMQKDSELSLEGKKYKLTPGLKDKIFKNGFYTDLDLNLSELPKNFELELELNGMENLEFVPLGKFTEVSVNSYWNNPSFTGAFLPAAREVNEDGFTAQWKVNYFNRSYPQEWLNQTYDPFPSTFGVKLLVPVDEYQKTMRTSKYGLMIIVLTFISFFMIEIFNKKVIHPVQYLLVGFALLIFYSILLSISEYILFQYSYLISSLLIIVLNGFYIKSIYQSGRISLLIVGLLGIFYGFMYVILQLQDYSLLIGNLALFIVLAAIMYFTRKINWFEVLSNKSKES